MMMGGKGKKTENRDGDKEAFSRLIKYQVYSGPILLPGPHRGLTIGISDDNHL